MNDLKFALRQLLKNPGFTAVAVLTLALGIGATTAIFSVANTALLRPLPYAKPEQLVRLYTEFPGIPNDGGRRFAFSHPEFLDLRRETKSWSALELWAMGEATLAGEADPIRAPGAGVTGGMLPMLGVAPFMGRLLSPEDDQPGAPKAANISFGLWQSLFAGDSNVVGRELLVNGEKHTVLGVMPKDFRFPPGAADAPQVWVPMQLDPIHPGGRAEHNFSLLGRLKDWVTLGQARQELEAFVKRAEETTAAGSHGFGAKDHPIVIHGLHDEVVRSIRPALRMLLGAVGFVLLIACVNVANLLLARAEARQKEIAIRGALGAGWRSLARQFVIEGVLLSLLGAVVGLFFAQGGLQLARAADEASLPRAAELALDGRVLLFTFGLSVVTGIGFGLAPFYHVARRSFHGTLKSAASSVTAGGATQRFRHVLVMGELALALMLLIGTGLMLRAFWKLQQVEAGFEPRGILTAQVALPPATYPDGPTQSAFWTRLETELTALPDVESAALVTGLPPLKQAVYSDLEIEGFVSVPGGPMLNVDFYQGVSPAYFKTLRIRLLEGRLFDGRDTPNATDVAVINRATARRFFGEQSPIGRRLRPGSGQKEWCTVIGVVEDVKNHGLENVAGTEVYFAMGQTYARENRACYVALRSRGEPAAMISPLRRVVRTLDPSLPLSRVRTLEAVMSAAQARPRFLATLLLIFSGVALVLATVGIYGVISYSVA
ncbi:MAG TPA: ABC transporter permease, partial [Candidatus Limnocylindria bacterium]|nr:ABC transporter permease [Candidatus Limnocylindria bacterium]